MMINTEAADILLAFAREIHKRAKAGDQPEEKETPYSRRAHDSAWRLVAHLIPFLEHTKESDLYWLLLDRAHATNKSAREQSRLRSVAKQEDREYMRAKDALTKLLKEIQDEEKADPRALIAEAEHRARRAEADRQEAERKAAVKAARAEARAAVKKAAAKVPAKKGRKLEAPSPV